MATRPGREDDAHGQGSAAWQHGPKSLSGRRRRKHGVGWQPMLVEAAAAAAARAVAIVGESCGAGRARRQWHEVASVAVLRQAHVPPD